MGLPVAYRVEGRTAETEDTWTIEIRPRDGSGLPEFAPGQFAMLYAFGAGEAPISVSGDLGGEGPLVHTIRSVGAVTRALCSAEPGTAIGVRGPYGVPWPIDAAHGHDVAVVAGGIGLAPLRPLVRRLLAERDRFGRISVLCGARTPESLLYPGELASWREAGVEAEVIVDGASPGWSGRVGVVTKLIDPADIDPARTVAFVCGPEVMMRFAARSLIERGVDRRRVHLSLERSMDCAVGICGHCQLRHLFVCKDGPVFALEAVEDLIRAREL